MQEAQLQPKICYTASGVLIHEEKVLLLKHKKVGKWLGPGGHIDPNELPHKAAEREFFEETGLHVRAVSFELDQHATDIGFVVNPILTNLHWVSKENFVRRNESPSSFTVDESWGKHCEQHCNFVFLVEPVGSLEYTLNEEESDAIGWFTKKELKDLDIFEDVTTEIEYAFSLHEKRARAVQ